MEKLGVAVIGTGFWGVNHARTYGNLESTKLVAICDIDSQRAKDVACQYGAKAYTDSTKMLKNKEIKAVSVCTWATILSEEANKALKAGRPVLVEKPMATTSKQAKKLIQTAKNQDLLLTVGFISRFLPGLKEIQKAIKTKAIGELVCATSKRVSQWPIRIGDAGVLKDTAIHDIDIMRYITGEDPISVYAKIGSKRRIDFEDHVQIMLTFKGEKSTFIESNWLTPNKTRTLTVTGTQAIMKLDYITQQLTIETNKENTQPRTPTQEPLKLELQHFADCIAKNQKPLVTGNDGLKALQIIEAAIKSSQKNKAINLK